MVGQGFEMNLVEFRSSDSRALGEYASEQTLIVDLLQRKWALSIECFHVFLLGGTGSGKSTFLNTLADLNVVETGVLRPTTSIIQVYGHESRAESMKNFPCSFFTHNHELLKDVCIWDLPDMDSHRCENHDAARLLREFADLLFIILHPEKTHQKSLEDFLKWYPVIPQIAWITHSTSIPADEAMRIQDSGWGNSSGVHLVDLKLGPQEAREKIFEVITRIQHQGMHTWKREILQKLSFQGLEKISPHYESLKKEQIRAENDLRAIDDFQSGTDLRLEDGLWMIFKEKVFGEISKRVLTEVLFASRSYFSAFSDLILRFSRESSVALDVPYMSVPLLRFEESVPGLNLPSETRDYFLDEHRKLILNCRVQLVSAARTPSTWFFIQEIFMDFLVPASVLTWALLHLEPIAANPMPVLVLILCMPILLILYWGRVQNRLKSVYRKGYELYRQGVLGEMQKLMEERHDLIQKQMVLREERLSEMKVFLDKCQESLNHDEDR